MQRSVKNITTIFSILILMVLYIGCRSSQQHITKFQPSCVEALITKLKQEERTIPVASVYSYKYNGRTVYFVPAPCCDFFSVLYDDSCKVIAHPDGGITGRGDGRAKDFFETRTDEVKIWEDDRKN